jgi:recombination protein RecA
VFTNQLRQKIGVMFGNPETTPGGLALKFYASVRMDSRKIETLKDGDKFIGTRHRVRVVKNKVSPPFRFAEFDVMHDGISKEGGLIDVGLELDVLTKSGAFYKYGGQIIGQGRDASKAYLQENPKVTKEITDAIWKAVKSGQAQTKVAMGVEETE